LHFELRFCFSQQMILEIVYWDLLKSQY